MPLGMGFEVSKERHHFEFSLLVAFCPQERSAVPAAMPVCCRSFPPWC